MSSSTIITVIASQRLFHRRASRCSTIGQVTTTMVVAQIVAAMNGRTIQNAAMRSAPMHTMLSRICVRSRRGGLGIAAS